MTRQALARASWDTRNQTGGGSGKAILSRTTGFAPWWRPAHRLRIHRWAAFIRALSLHHLATERPDTCGGVSCTILISFETPRDLRPPDGPVECSGEGGGDAASGSRRARQRLSPPSRLTATPDIAEASLCPGLLPGASYSCLRTEPASAQRPPCQPRTHPIAIKTPLGRARVPAKVRQTSLSAPLAGQISFGTPRGIPVAMSCRRPSTGLSARRATDSVWVLPGAIVTGCEHSS